jgi:hypothetical protein
MKYIKFTYVDAQTNICVNKAPAKNGPKFPEIKGLQYLFSAESVSIQPMSQSSLDSVMTMQI